MRRILHVVARTKQKTEASVTGRRLTSTHPEASVGSFQVVAETCRVVAA